MSYISLEINKSGKNVEILLGGSAIEQSEMKGGIRLLINNIEASLLNPSLLDKNERESAHHDKQDELEEQPITTAAAVPEEMKLPEQGKPLKQSTDRKTPTPDKESTAILSRAVIDLINAECSANGSTMASFFNAIAEWSGKKGNTIQCYYYQITRTPANVASIIGETIGYQLEIKKDEFSVPNWFPGQKCNKSKALPVKQKYIKKVHKSVQKVSKDSVARHHLSSDMLKKIDEYLDITRLSKLKLAKLLATKSDKTYHTILNMLNGAIKMPEAMALILGEILGVSISRTANLLGEEKWTVSTDKVDKDSSTVSENSTTVTRLSGLVLKRIKEYRTAMAIDEMLFAHRVANNSGLLRETLVAAIQGGDVSEQVATAFGDVLQVKLHKVMFADGSSEWAC